MHIHSAQASALGNALAGAQAAETAVSMRRARELRDAALRLKAASMEIHTGIPQNPETDPETTAQTVSMIAAWSASPGSGQAAQQSIPLLPSGESSSQKVSSQVQEVQRTPPSNPVSYWA